jgi:hypothetical protein
MKKPFQIILLPFSSTPPKNPSGYDPGEAYQGEAEKLKDKFYLRK